MGQMGLPGSHVTSVTLTVARLLMPDRPVRVFQKWLTTFYSHGGQKSIYSNIAQNVKSLHSKDYTPVIKTQSCDL